MSNKKMVEIILLIEEYMRELAKETGSNHISAFVIDGNFSIDDYSNLQEQKFSYYHNGGDNE